MFDDRKYYMTKNLAHAIHHELLKMDTKDQIVYLSDFLYFLSMEDIVGFSDDLGINQEYLIDDEL